MTTNNCFFSGVVSNDSEIKMTPTGKAIVKFMLGVPENKKDEAGQWTTTWHNIPCELWRNTPDNIDWIKKGVPIFVSGRMHMDRWTSQDGKNNTRLKCLVQAYEPLQKKLSQGKAPSAAPLPLEAGF